ncbi:CHAT domain-containing protein [Trichoderma camerunense]
MEREKLLLASHQSTFQTDSSDDLSTCLESQRPRQDVMEDLENIVVKYQDEIENFIDQTLKDTNQASPDSGLAVLYSLGENPVGIRESIRKLLLYFLEAIEIALRSFETNPVYREYWLERFCTHASQTVGKCTPTKAPVLEDIEGDICTVRKLRTVQGLVAVITLDCSSYASSTYYLGKLLYDRFLKTRDMADLDKAIAISRSIIEVPLIDHLDRQAFSLLLMLYLMGRYNSTEQMADVEEAICLGQNFINTSPPNHPMRAMGLHCVSSCLFNRYSITEDFRDLNEAIISAQEAADNGKLTNLADPVWVRYLYSEYLAKRYESSGETEDLEEAIYILFEAAETCSTDDQRWILLLGLLACLLLKRYDYTKTLADIDGAVNLLRGVITTITIDHPRRHLFLAQFGSYLNKRYQSSGAVVDLEEVICASRAALDATSWDFEASEALANSLHDRYLRTGALSDIDECIHIMLEVIGSMPIDHPKRVNVLEHLGRFLGIRAKQTGALTDFDRSIFTYRDCLSAASLDPTLRAIVLGNLGISLSGRYTHTRAMSDLEESISLIRKAIASMTTLQEDVSEYMDNALHNLALFLQMRYIRTGGIEDLNEVISLLQKFFETEHDSLSDRERPRRLLNFSIALNLRFKHLGEIADLMEAILIAREAANMIPKDDLKRNDVLRCLGTHLSVRFSHTGAKADIDEAICVFQDALHTSSPGRPDQAALLTKLGGCFHVRFVLAKAVADANIAAQAARSDDDITLHLKVLETRTASIRYHLKLPTWKDVSNSECFYTEVEAEALADIENARKCYIDALYHETAVLSIRFSAGHGALFLPYFIDYPKAYEVAKSTIDLIPLLAPRSLQNSDKQNILSGAVGISSISAAIALHQLPANQRTLAAIECLETGRGLIGGALFQQYEVSVLEKHHPDLAQYFLTLRDRLDKPALEGFGLLNNSHTVDIEESECRKTEQQFTELLEIIRLRKDFQRFLLPASEIDMLHAAACGGPIVILNMSHYRCDALIIEESGLRTLEFPHLSQEMFPEYIFAQRYEALQSLKTLSWLWDDIVRPVLDALGFTEPPSNDSWPHVWWIPTGGFTKFPLHAAGHHLRRSGETTLDRVISSYATSVKAIIHSRQRGALRVAEPLNLVAIAMEETEEQAPLVHAGREVDSILNILKSKGVNCNLPQPYKGDVLSAMMTCQIFHFAGHGETHPTDPLQSTLLLRDWQSEPLTIASLLESNLTSNSPFLAYLSACGTGRVINEKLEDESIHLASAFQIAGFRHVIGTLWSVDDELCVEIAEMVYETLREEMRDDLVSQGLHNAVRTLRDRWVDKADGGIGNKSRTIDGSRENRHCQLDDDEELGRPLWIPYVHFGV